jgi:RNA polymerase sigma factor for flagellar operon FliA
LGSSRTSRSGHTLGRLWERYLEAREGLERLGENDPARAGLRRQASRLRDRLIVNYSPLVKYVTGRMPAGIRGVVETEELMSWGRMGLLSAIETFDPGRETKFESYAISKVRWAMLDEFRKQDWVPRRVRAQIQEAERAASRLAQSLRRAPTELEMAGEMNLSLEEYRSFVATFYFYEGLTLREIGRALGLSEGRISQILRQALMKLRAKLAESPLKHY